MALYVTRHKSCCTQPGVELSSTTGSCRSLQAASECCASLGWAGVCQLPSCYSSVKAASEFPQQLIVARVEKASCNSARWCLQRRCMYTPVMIPISTCCAVGFTTTRQTSPAPFFLAGLTGLVTASSSLASVTSSSVSMALLRLDTLDRPPDLPFDPPLDRSLEPPLEVERLAEDPRVARGGREPGLLVEGVMSMQMGSLSLRPVPAQRSQMGREA